MKDETSSDPQGFGGLPAALTLAGVLLLFTVSATLLDLLGFNYDSPSGGALEKVHPGTDFIALGLLVLACRDGNPLRYLLRSCRRFPGLTALMGATLLLMVYQIKVQAAPFTPLIDTFVMPCFLFLLLVDLPQRSRRLLEIGLHVFLVGNALLGIYEFVTDWRLVPLQLNGLTITQEMEWRAAGLLGHPLASAATAGLYAVILALGGGGALPAVLRLPIIGLQLIALAAFGGRTALVATLLILAILLAFKAAGLLAGQRFNRHAAGLTFLLAPLVAGAAYALLGGGFFDQILARFVEDNGSAESRAIILNLFSHLQMKDILVGPNPDHIATLQHLEGIEVGIESFWLAFVLQNGLILACVFFAALGAFTVHVMQAADRLAVVPLMFFILIISSSISLSAKSTSLGQFIVLVTVLMPAVRRSSPATGGVPLPSYAAA